ncbi:MULTISPECIES: Arm DNA-binding domain-containing protein [unclassified Marinobacter]|uniref:Arm DNA-binding domain-containing protein n=1 Tax=unclassified Marinobacter TaxID=83889 RepID=UPI0039B77D2B
MSRPLNLLTDRKVQSAKFEKLGKRTKLSDGAGLYLDIQPSGKYWRMKYRKGRMYPFVPFYSCSESLGRS